MIFFVFPEAVFLRNSRGCFLIEMRYWQPIRYISATTGPGEYYTI